MAQLRPRPRFRRRRRDGDSAAPRSLGCLWPMFWLILIIVLLGLLFGGYRKGTKVGAPQEPAVATYTYAYTYALGSTHSQVSP